MQDNHKAALFARAFHECWHSVYSINELSISANYCDDTAWTRYMLAEAHCEAKECAGLLQRVTTQWFGLIGREDLEYRSKHQWYTMDAYVVERALRSEHYTKTSLHLIIEHENGDNPEEEMWKLIHFRAPLKVLFFYDWSDCAKGSSRAREKTLKTRKQWLPEKLRQLNTMLVHARNVHPEAATTQYLLIIGSRDLESVIVWKYYLADQGTNFQFEMYGEPD